MTTSVPPVNHTACTAVTKARLVGPRSATWLPGPMPRACSRAAMAMASSWRRAHSTRSGGSLPCRNVTPFGRSTARSILARRVRTKGPTPTPATALRGGVRDSHHEDGEVVAQPVVLEVEDVALDALGQGVSVEAGRRGHERLQPLEPVEAVRTGGVHDAVGAEHNSIAGTEVDGAVDEPGVRERADERAGTPDRADAAVGPQDQWERMPAARHGQTRAARPG